MGGPPSAADQKIATDMLSFLNAGLTEFHAVDAAVQRLKAAGFTELSERQGWEVQRGGRYFFTRNSSTLVAFAVGQKYEPGNGFMMVGAHTDSPCFKLKPVSKSFKSGYGMVNCEPYGGLLHHTWFDRDLTVAGRVLVKQGDRMVHKLVSVPKPILRIPMLAIHLQRDLSTAGFNPNKQTQCTPLLATSISKKLSAAPAGDGVAPAAAVAAAAGDQGLAARHHPLLLRLLSKELGCEVDDIVDFELNVIDTQAGVVGGGEDEFIFCGRLDNLCMSYCCLQALVDTCANAEALADETGVRAIALFDNEEVGSDSAQGAGSPVMRDCITRVTQLLAEGAEGAVQRAMRNSFLISADMAHALHPNYADKHDPELAPRLGSGLVLKHNVNQRYATNAVSATLFREVCRRAGVPTAEFAVRSDMACGSTIGPILAAGLGVRTVDIGVPQLAMHSIREMCMVSDAANGLRAFTAFFETISELDRTVDPDTLPPPDIRGTLREPACGHVH
ncbi:hypothetical protein D9Q98_002978 [Chlorella vulgaris]|uniref:aspartyl aminopeptidase n=1 Tax=Chlorella vulgaris TaxID=3077 RepID=A0A9D4TUS3_CHLVU|nr:hypothetical protein D9Q98_002978 [Chlorella vulgaris]